MGGGVKLLTDKEMEAQSMSSANAQPFKKCSIVFADPPYIGQAKKHYNSEEVDHKALITQLEVYDGWAN